MQFAITSPTLYLDSVGMGRQPLCHHPSTFPFRERCCQGPSKACPLAQEHFGPVGTKRWNQTTIFMRFFKTNPFPSHGCTPNPKVFSHFMGTVPPLISLLRWRVAMALGYKMLLWTRCVFHLAQLALGCFPLAAPEARVLNTPCVVSLCFDRGQTYR